MKKRYLCIATAVSIAVLISTLAFLSTHVREIAEQVVFLTIPFSKGDVFTLDFVVSMSDGNNTFLLNKTSLTVIVEEPGFPFTYVKTIQGFSMRIPTMYLAVPRERFPSFSAPVLIFFFNEYVCVEFTLERNGLYESSLPSTCKPVYITIEYSEETSLVVKTESIIVLSGYTYIERVYVVSSATARRETRVRPVHVCDKALSTDISMALPGLYYFGTTGWRYVVDGNYSKYRPLLGILKTRENQELWSRVLKGEYRGYVLLVSLILVDVSAPEVERVFREKIVEFK